MPPAANKTKFASIIVTYRCNARCQMCNTWQFPSDPLEESGLEVYRKLPDMQTVNVTGGEPFLREDLNEIVGVLKSKSQRLVISTNGYFTEKIVSLCEKHKEVGIRVSLEGLQEANDELRGLQYGFAQGLKTLQRLKAIGIRDIGFGITVSDRNALDMLELYELAVELKLEFATAAIHNSYYFHKYDNRFEEPETSIVQFKVLAEKLLQSNRAKDWFRAYFNFGLMNYIDGRKRLLPCSMGHDSFFLDPYGEIFPCNVMQSSMGNLREKSFDEIWTGQKAERVRMQVMGCEKNCWMIGSVSQQMKRNIHKPAWWVFKHKFLGKEVLLPKRQSD